LAEFSFHNCPYLWPSLKSILSNIISFTLIAALLMLGVSPEVFHEHEEHTLHCDNQHAKNEADECHIRLYHEGGSLSCSDHQHLFEGHEDCLICQLQVPQVNHLKIHDTEGSLDLKFQTLLAYRGKKSVSFAFTDEKNTRGPPSMV